MHGEGDCVSGKPEMKQNAQIHEQNDASYVQNQAKNKRIIPKSRRKCPQAHVPDTTGGTTAGTQYAVFQKDARRNSF